MADQMLGWCDKHPLSFLLWKKSNFWSVILVSYLRGLNCFKHCAFVCLAVCCTQSAIALFEMLYFPVGSGSEFIT